MRLISWNVNGIRSCRQKGFDDFLREIDADMLCLQEVKATQEQSGLDPEGYHIYWHAAERKGYSGTAVLTRAEPLSVSRDMPGHAGEGRILTLELEQFYLVNIYTPNSKRELERLEYRMEWQDALKAYLMELDSKKPVVFCGDLNIAHQPIDLARPAANRRNAGFTDEERAKMTDLMSGGFSDTFRALHPEETGAYSWWSYMGGSRGKNVGWRIDYFLVSHRLLPCVSEAQIYPEVLGSDHCPVGITLLFYTEKVKDLPFRPSTTISPC